MMNFFITQSIGIQKQCESQQNEVCVKRHEWSRQNLVRLFLLALYYIVVHRFGPFLHITPNIVYRLQILFAQIHTNIASFYSALEKLPPYGRLCHIMSNLLQD